MKLNIGKDMYLKGRIGWKGLSKNEYLDKSEYKIINATALNDGLVDYENCGFISKERFLESEDIIVKNNDILISKDGTLGKIGYVKNLNEKLTVASGIFILRNSKIKELNMDYLYHILKSDIFKRFINKKKALGSTINHLYQRDLEQFEIDIPDYKQQTSISNILNQIELKMDINNRIIMKLESMMKDIYDYWFVQFDFPNEKGKPYKSSGGKMVYNEKLKREIPAIFEIEKLCNITNIYQPKTISEKDLDINGQYFVYGANGIIGKYNKYNHECNEIAICCRGASCGNLLMTLPFSWITGNSMIVSPIEDANVKEFIYYYLLKHGLKKYVTGSAQPQITRANIEKMNIVLPHNDVLNNFNEIALAVRKKTIKLILENNILKEYKCFILPFLMNGQVEVK